MKDRFERYRAVSISKNHLCGDITRFLVKWTHELSYEEKKTVKHIVEEGSRRHVMYYDNFGAHCSEPNCEMNHIGTEEGLHKCPCCPATKCKMDEPCLGCETYGEWINGENTLFKRK